MYNSGKPSEKPQSENESNQGLTCTCYMRSINDTCTEQWWYQEKMFFLCFMTIGDRVSLF